MDENKVRYIRFSQLTLNEPDGGSLHWGVRMGFPRITVIPERIQDGDNYNEKIITAPFNVPTLHLLLEYMEEVVNGEKGQYKSIECRNVKYVNGERTSETFVQSTVIVGKDKDGIIFITLVSEGKKRVKFSILPDSRWYRIYHNNTEVTDKAEISRVFGRAYIKAVRQAYNQERLEENVRISEADRPANGSNYGKPFKKKDTEPIVKENTDSIEVEPVSNPEPTPTEEKPKDEFNFGSLDFDI